MFIAAPPRLARFDLASLLAVLTLLALGVPAPLVAQLERQEKATMSVAADRTAYAAGSEASLVVEMEIEPGWHTNSHQPTYDYLIPTEIEVAVPDGWSEPSVAYPPGEMKSFSFAEEEISVYEGRVVMVATQPIPTDLETDSAPLEIALTYQACDDRRCLPPVTTRREIELALGEEGRPTEAAAALEGTPPAAADGASPAVEAPALAWLLLLGFLGGVILNAMPCVLPVLSLKLFGLVKSAGQGRSAVVAGALATSAGILFSFLALALMAVVAKAGGAAVGWGIQFQNPTFVAALTVVVLLFCLNLWGLFEIPLPGRLASAADSASGSSLAGHFGSGLFATLMATPCSAPFLGTAIGFGLSQSASTIVAIFAAIGVGMAAPYLLLAGSPGSVRFLPEPGAWMGHLKVVMGFLLAGAAVWLLYVLAAQIPPEQLAFFELALLVMALAVWVHHAAGRRPARLAAMRGILASIAIGLVLVSRAEVPAGASQRVESRRMIDWETFDRQEAPEPAGPAGIRRRDGRLVLHLQGQRTPGTRNARGRRSLLAARRRCDEGRLDEP